MRRILPLLLLAGGAWWVWSRRPSSSTPALPASPPGDQSIFNPLPMPKTPVTTTTPAPIVAPARDPVPANAPRGVRNHNPGNIKHGSSKWLGMSAVQDDPTFVQFDQALYGLRALYKLLQNYYRIYGLNTIRGIITRWAPGTENNTAAYINAVTARMGRGWSADTAINLDDAGQLVALMRAIIDHENGNGWANHYGQKINQALQLQ